MTRSRGFFQATLCTLFMAGCVWVLLYDLSNKMRDMEMDRDAYKSALELRRERAYNREWAHRYMRELERDKDNAHNLLYKYVCGYYYVHNVEGYSQDNEEGAVTGCMLYVWESTSSGHFEPEPKNWSY